MSSAGRLYQMYSAEPLPHFVDEYLSYLYEVHPTNATFDGVHLHDDLLEDWSRQAIEAQIRDLGGFARRLGAIDPARLTDSERLERPALDASIRARLFELEEVRTWERSPQQYADLSLIHISEPTRLLSISYAVFCLKKK